jgi:hypothetical protein
MKMFCASLLLSAFLWIALVRSNAREPGNIRSCLSLIPMIDVIDEKTSAFSQKNVNHSRDPFDFSPLTSTRQ